MIPSSSIHPSWLSMRDRFLDAVEMRQRPQVASMLRLPQHGGRGLRAWLGSIAAQRSCMPDSIPEQLVQVYLEDSEAIPLHDCASCGVAIPVRPAWDGYEEEPDQVYFSRCPCCGGPTGLYAYWSRRAEEAAGSREETIS
jgi:hypothetical protein